MKKRTKHPKLIRMKNRKGATYSLSSFGIGTNKKQITCPSCGKKVPKGEGIKSSYLSNNSGFWIRHRIHCSEKCTPDEIKSK
jgi:endogenous inhibitor of DNA gyrase (YacG/DUF329 family)